MLPAGALQGMKPFFATPCLGGQTTSPYTASIFGLGGDCIKMGMPSNLEFHSESLISRARNLMTVKFLADASYTHLFFLDADLLFSSAAVFRCLLADKDIAVQVYPIKHHNWPPIMPAGMTETELEERYGTYPFFPTETESDDDGFAKVYPATTGFMCIKREVFPKMMEAYPERRYTPDDDRLPAHLHYDLFSPLIEPTSGHYWSEDYGFCYLWNAIRGEVWADTESKLGHYGQHLFRGNLIEHLNHRQPAPKQEAA